MTETIFTKIINKEIPANIIYEDDNTIAFLDICPFEKGHTLVVPKKVYKTIMDMPENEYSELMSVVKKISTHLAEELKCGINIWQNNKEVAGQEVPHVHFHVVPRSEDKGWYRSDNCVKYLNNEAKNYTKRLKLN